MKSAAAVMLWLCAPVADAQIFADVATTMGNFTIELRPAESPRAVANFIRLAEGSTPWVDEATGRVHFNRPFYNGLTFHRVIADFMSQAGSRLGDGSDGPGYVFPDELDNGLSHNAPHIVSMANSGPNSNGSQFFITDVDKSADLDGIHTVFGSVVSGQAVCDDINNVATNSNDKPLVPVVIQSIAIRRVGAEALAFDEHAQALPAVTAPPVDIQHHGTGAILEFNQPARSVAAIALSPDCVSWPRQATRFLDATAAAATALDLTDATAGDPRQFFATSVTLYPPDGIFPQSFVSRQFRAFTPLATFDFRFNADGTGTWAVPSAGIEGNLEYAAATTPYGGTLLMYLEGLLYNGTSFPWARFGLGYDDSNESLLSGRHDGRLAATQDNLYIYGNHLDLRGIFQLTR
jgi:cyclophilin family peptidyl-prolyl cis-trans isomerase